MADNRKYVPDETRRGTFSLFVYRAWGQTSQQATVERPRVRPLIIPRSGSAAPTAAPTMVKKSRGM